jgi:hypothetical protein
MTNFETHTQNFTNHILRLRRSGNEPFFCQQYNLFVKSILSSYPQYKHVLIDTFQERYTNFQLQTVANLIPHITDRIPSLTASDNLYSGATIYSDLPSANAASITPSSDVARLTSAVHALIERFEHLVTKPPSTDPPRHTSSARSSRPHYCFHHGPGNHTSSQCTHMQNNPGFSTAMRSATHPNAAEKPGRRDPLPPRSSSGSRKYSK